MEVDVEQRQPLMSPTGQMGWDKWSRERERRDQIMMRGKFNLDRNTSLTTHLPFLPLLSTEQVFSK